MADDRFVIRDSEEGRVEISKEVISVIAGMSALEVSGISSLAGTITADSIGKTDARTLAKGIRVEIEDSVAVIDLAITLGFGVNIQEAVTKVQERVKTTVVNIVGLEVSDVNIKVIGVDAEA